MTLQYIRCCGLDDDLMIEALQPSGRKFWDPEIWHLENSRIRNVKKKRNLINKQILRQIVSESDYINRRYIKESAE